jgi:signal transduction histidine kinase/DNA-binding response OmpR family regulator
MADTRPAPKRGIQRKALIIVLPLIVVPMLAIGLVSFYRLNKKDVEERKSFRKDRQNEILTISENQSVANYFHNIAYGLSEEATMYKEELERYFKRFSDRYNSIAPTYDAIRYIDENGKEIAKVIGGKIGGEYQNVADEAFFQTAVALSPDQVNDPQIGPEMVYAMPIFWDEDGNGEYSKNELRGVIVTDIIYPVEKRQEERQIMALVTLGITILAIIITMIAVTFQLRRVTRPIIELVGATKSIASGDLSTEIAVTTEDEVGLLASSFNQMARDLRRTNDEKDGYARDLKNLNVELEDKVKERTQELEVANEELQKANIKIREADRLKSEFLANMSHELRTPMNAIIGFTRLVHRKTSDLLPAKQRENLEKVEMSANQLLNLINDILDLSKIEAGKMTVSIMPVHLAPLVDACFATVEPMVKKETVRLVKDVPPEFPELTTDQDKLKQIIINLLSNALKFTEQGEVKLSVAPEDSKVKITVSDTGIGMPPEALKYIFDEFRQVDGSSTRKHGGTGLGLSITKKLVDLLGGTLDVSSVVNEGSTFTILLPLEAKKQVVIVKPEVTEEESPSPSTIEGKKVVLSIDDDPNVHILLRENLDEEGYYVMGALGGEAGIKKAREFQPFAIILDILMSEKDGWDVLNELKADPGTRHIPIIVLSIVDNRELGFSLGAFDYLVKPFDKATILAALERAPGAKPNRVLIVDDEPSAVDLITQLLEEDGYRIRGVHSGDEALRSLEKELPDVILLDLLMPGMDGFEVIQRIKEKPEWRDIPIVVITAKDLTEADFKFLRQRVDKIIRKSGLDRQKLVGEVQQLLREHAGSGKEGDDR